MSDPKRRLFSKTIEGSSITLRADAARHAKVLRLGVGDRVVLFDGRSKEADARITAIDAEHVALEIEAVHERESRAPSVVLIQCMPKGSKLDEIVRSTTEAGVTAIHLAIAERSVAKPEEDRSRKKLERLLKIAQEASRQSERAEIPAIAPPASLDEVVARAPADATRLILSPRTEHSWKSALTASTSEAWLIIGPEGGLSESEILALRSQGWIEAKIDVPILRVETAAPIAVALLRDHLAQSGRAAGDPFAQ